MAAGPWAESLWQRRRRKASSRREIVGRGDGRNIRYLNNVGQNLRFAITGHFVSVILSSVGGDCRVDVTRKISSLDDDGGWWIFSTVQCLTCKLKFRRRCANRNTEGFTLLIRCSWLYSGAVTTSYIVDITGYYLQNVRRQAGRQ